MGNPGLYRGALSLGRIGELLSLASFAFDRTYQQETYVMLWMSFRNVLLVAAAVSFGTLTLTLNADTVEETRPYFATADYVAIGSPTGVLTGFGEATHLGRFTESASYIADCDCEGDPEGEVHLLGEATQVAANGDTLTYTFDETVDFSTYPFTAFGYFTITGGTGKYEGATGGGVIFTEGIFLNEAGDSFGLSTHYVGEISF
jgi:hypothetical protein